MLQLASVLDVIHEDSMLRYQCNAIFQDSMCWVNTILPSSPFCPLSNSGANSNHGAKRVHQRGISALSVQISNNRYFCESHLFSAFAQQFGEQIFLPLHPVFQVLKPTLTRHQRLVQKVHYQVAKFTTNFSITPLMIWESDSHLVHHLRKSC